MDLSDVEVFRVEHSSTCWRVFHEAYAVCLIRAISGSCDWRYRARDYSTPARCLTLMEPGETHVTKRLGSAADFSVVHLAPRLVAEIGYEMGQRAAPHLETVSVSDPELVAAFARLHDALDSGTVLERQSRLIRCVGLVVERCGEARAPAAATPSTPVLLRARDYLVDGFAERISLAELAAVAGLTRFQLLRAFTRHFGLPPHAYQIQVRLARVRALLKRGVPIRDIEAGFADQPHLSRTFKRFFGVTPAQYAAAVRIPARGSSPRAE